MRNLYKTWHSEMGLQCDLILDNNKYTKGDKVLDFTFGPCESGKLGKVAAFFCYVMQLSTRQGHLRSKDYIDKVRPQS